MQRWSEEHRAFAVETFFKNNDSATVTQRAFRRHFDIGSNGKVPTRQTRLNCVTQFRTTASIVDKKPPGGTMLNSGHEQALANTCVAAVAAISDCRRTRVTNDGRRSDTVLSYLYIVYCIYWIIFKWYALHFFFAFTLFVRVVLFTRFVSLSSRFHVNTGSTGFMLFLYILQ
jgi:hypothetical protein